MVFWLTPKRHFIRFSFYGKFESLCSTFSFVKFPFDTQTCDLLFYSEDPVTNYNLTTAEVFVDPTEFIPASEIWQFVSASQSVEEFPDVYFKIWRITVKISLQRKYQYYIGNVFLPTFALYLIQLAAFLLPPETSDRPTFSVTVVLAFTFVLTSVFSLIPRTTETVYLVILLEIKLFLSVFLTCYMLFSCSIANKSNWSHSFIRKLDWLIGISSFVIVTCSDITLISLMVAE